MSAAASWGHPLCLLDDPAALAAWQWRVGRDRAQRYMDDACRERMARHGPRSILEVVERMDDVAAYLEEFHA